MSRLVREDNFPLRKTTTWEYDAGGNIFNRKEYTYTLNDDLSKYVDESLLNDNETNNNTYNTFKTIPYSYANSGIRDRLIGYGSKPTEQNKQFEYDAIGNPKIYRGKTFKWSHGRLLDAIGIGSDENFVQQHSYTYNANGIRISKTMTIPLKQVEGPAVNGAMTLDYFLDGNKIISQQDVANKIFFIYGVDGIIGFTIQYNNTEESYYYKKNLQGDIIGLYNSAMVLIAKYEYDAWGNHIVKYLDNSGNFVATESQFCYNDVSNINRFIANKNPFRYRGYYYDFETGLYYLNSRYYDPEIGRFINIDEITVLDVTNIALNGINLYAYCLNNPVNEVDESGYILGWLIGLFISIVVVAITNTLVQLGSDLVNYAATGTWDSGWEDYLGAFFGGMAGGAVFFLTGNIGLTFGVMGAVETLSTDLLTNYTGRTNYDIKSLIIRSIGALGVGAISGWMFGGTKIIGLTAGKNSWFSIWKSGLTRLFRNNAQKMSFKVIIKGFVAFNILKLGGTILKGALSGWYEWIREIFFGEKGKVNYV